MLRRFCWILVVLLLVGTGVAANASATQWSLLVKAGNGTTFIGSQGTVQLGIAATAATPFYFSGAPTNVQCGFYCIDADPTRYGSKDVRAAGQATYTWNMRLQTGTSWTTQNISIGWNFPNTSLAPGNSWTIYFYRKGSLFATVTDLGTGYSGTALNALPVTADFGPNPAGVTEDWQVIASQALFLTVTDDGQTTTNSNQLHAIWAPVNGSATSYQYAIGTSPTDLIVDWKSAGSNTEATETGLTLEPGKTYYWYVKGQSIMGWGLSCSSDGITAVLPTAPSVTDDGLYTDPSMLHARWTASDPWGIAAYQYAIGTSQTNLIVDWKSAGTNTEATESGLSLEPRKTYYWYVKAQNTPGLWSSVGSSDGIVPRFKVSLSAAKRMPVNSAVWIDDLRVTSAPSDLSGLWAASSDRISGISIPAAWAVARGDTLSVVGLINWSNGIPSLASPELKNQTPGTLWKSPYANNYLVAGDPLESLHYNCPDPVGLLFTTFGKVTRLDTANHVFYIDDGSGLTDGMGPSYDPFVGLRVKYKTGTTPPLTGKKVLITGIRSVETATLVYDAVVNGRYRFAGEVLYLPVLVTRDSGDIRVVK